MNLRILHIGDDERVILDLKLLRDLLTEVDDGVRIPSKNLNLQVLVPFSTYVIRNIVKTHRLGFPRNRQQQSHVGIESDAHPFALGADKSRLILSVEKIDNDGVVSHHVLLLGFSRSNCIGLAFRFIDFDIRLLFLSIKIFAEQV